MRWIFMGTPEWALPSLEALFNAGEEVAGVLTQPDRPVGRKQVQTPSAVKVRAQELGIPVFTPERVGDSIGQEALRTLRPEALLVCAYGQLLPQSVLDLPPQGCYNLHFSLLPRWRGASPVQAAIAAGDAHTGVSLQKMVMKLDAGPLVARSEVVPIQAQDTSETLGARLASLGGELIRDALPLLSGGAPEAQPQDEAQVTICRILRKEQGRIHWDQDTAVSLERRLRAFTPWPGLYCFGPDGKRLQLTQVEARAESDGGSEAASVPGIVLPEFFVGTAEGTLQVLRLRPEGKGEMTATEFLRGRSDWVGKHLRAS
jgi:methionyl-tRNA formyltransferase